MPSVDAQVSTTPDTKTRLKFVIYRPHSNIWFRNTVGRILKKKLYPNKYAPFFDHLLKSDVDVFFTSSLDRASNPKALLQWAFDCFELFSWCILNKISIQRIGFIFSKRKLAGKDALFIMHYGNLTYETVDVAGKGQLVADCLSGERIYKIVHLTHYVYCPRTGVNNLARLQPDLLVAENDLKSNSGFFSHHFKKIACDFWCLPYIAAEKFIHSTDFGQRINKLLVTGSITYKMKDPEFLAFFHGDELQPMRRQIYSQAANYTAQMDCFVSDLNASRTEAGSKGNSQQAYYKKDIVALYNSYAMFAVPEEVCDLPAIGFVEGMACGAAYFGLDDPMYRDLGMVPGVHYVCYDGTVADLMNKVGFFQQHPEQLKQIAEAGCQFVNSHLRAAVVYDRFINELKRTVHSRALV